MRGRAATGPPVISRQYGTPWRSPPWRPHFATSPNPAPRSGPCGPRAYPSSTILVPAALALPSSPTSCSTRTELTPATDLVAVVVPERLVLPRGPQSSCEVTQRARYYYAKAPRAQVLRQAARAGNTLSATIRSAWCKCPRSVCGAFSVSERQLTFPPPPLCCRHSMTSA